ncbi:MAG: aminobenzoyl-glutamate utilization protein B [Cellvibrionaceae bacterium]|jgi:aminobenzoyl-glutamate utilization protein B
MNTQINVADWLNNNQNQFIEMADTIWGHPEIRWQEFKSSKLQADYMEEAGFDVKWDIGGITTAFVAEWKSGDGASKNDGPKIGFLGEYDALPGLSQKNQATPDPVEQNGHGHGCGHNLLGTGALAAAVSLKQWLGETETSGTVRYYGCPAEEGGGGKVFMARDGVFDDLDAAFNFHPGNVNMAMKGSAIGVNHVRFQFHGRTAHAGGSPHLGRSALDGVELMNVGVNYLREHVTDKVRLHYQITHGGGAPNVVPDFAEVFYYIRAHMPEEVAEVTERVMKVAKGAAMMTETEVEMIYDSGTTCVLSNHTLSDLQYEVMQKLGPIEFTELEMAYAAEINAQNPPGVREFLKTRMKLTDEEAAMPLLGQARESNDADDVMTGSTDVGDISWITPLSMLVTTCWPTNVSAHTWGVVATGQTGIGHKGMMYAAQVMAGAAVELFKDPAKLQAVRAEFEGHIAKRPYVSPLPDDCQPPNNKHPLR